jgi:nitrate/nitrite transport system ATP-binding protein
MTETLTTATPGAAPEPEPLTNGQVGAATPSGSVAVDGVTKSFAAGRDRVDVLGRIDLTIGAGEFVSLIGPSGSGKSTLLNIVAGLVAQDDGAVRVDGVPVTGPGADRGVVFQHHVLLPWMTARQNLLFALDCTMGDRPAEVRRRIADRYLELVHLSEAADRRPSQLSGGMQQRVGIARALAIEPKVLLLDEPFGALDALTRIALQDELLRIWEAEQRTVLMVTHDVEEAALLSDRIVVLGNGPSASVREVVDVPFDRPRDREELLRLQEYQDLRSDLLELLIR